MSVKDPRLLGEAGDLGGLRSTCLQAAVAAGQAGALSSHPLTQAILAQLALLPPVEESKVDVPQVNPDQSETVANFNHRAEFHKERGEYSEAEHFYGLVVEIQQQQHGADHLDTATSLNNLAELYRFCLVPRLCLGT